MKGKAVIEFKKRNYIKGKADFLKAISREISETAFKRKDFGITFSDAKKIVTFMNAELVYYPDMFGLKVFAAPNGKKITHGYQLGRCHTIELNLTCFSIKGINGDRLEKALKKLRGK